MNRSEPTKREATRSEATMREATRSEPTMGGMNKSEATKREATKREASMSEANVRSPSASEPIHPSYRSVSESSQSSNRMTYHDPIRSVTESPYRGNRPIVDPNRDTAIERFRKEKTKRVPMIAPDIFDLISPRVFPNVDGNWMTIIDVNMDTQLLIDITGAGKNEPISPANVRTGLPPLPVRSHNDFITTWTVGKNLFRSKSTNGSAHNLCPGCVAYIVTDTNCINTSIIGNVYEELTYCLTVEYSLPIPVIGAPLVNQYGSIVGIIYRAQDGMARAYAIDSILSMINSNQPLILDIGIKWRDYHDGRIGGALIVHHNSDCMKPFTDGIDDRYVIRSISERPTRQLLLTLSTILSKDANVRVELYDRITGESKEIKVGLQRYRRPRIRYPDFTVNELRDLLHDKITHFSSLLVRNQENVTNSLTDISKKIHLLENRMNDMIDPDKLLADLELSQRSGHTDNRYHLADLDSLSARVELLESSINQPSLIDDDDGEISELYKKLDDRIEALECRIEELSSQISTSMDHNQKTRIPSTKSSPIKSDYDEFAIDDDSDDRETSSRDGELPMEELAKNDSLDSNELLVRIEQLESKLCDNDSLDDSNLLTRIEQLESKLSANDSLDDSNLLARIEQLESKLCDSNSFTDSNLLARIEQLESKLSANDSLDSNLLTRIEQLESKLSANDSFTDSNLLTRIEQLESKLSANDSFTDSNLLTRIEQLESKLCDSNSFTDSNLLTRIEQLESKLSANDSTDDGEIKNHLGGLSLRIVMLENKLSGIDQPSDESLTQRVSQLEEIILLMESPDKLVERVSKLESDRSVEYVNEVKARISDMESRLKHISGELSNRLAILEGKTVADTLKNCLRRLDALESKSEQSDGKDERSANGVVRRGRTTGDKPLKVEPSRTVRRDTKNNDERSAKGSVRRTRTTDGPLSKSLVK